jgi:prevent-host-death family protein
MSQVNITELRKNLPNYLKKVGKGEELLITSRGKVVARIVPEQDRQALALERLRKQRGTVIIGDIIAPIDEEAWSADEDNL